jgi:two-component system cell cycle sensor histidine kinase/response regulator CckA
MPRQRDAHAEFLERALTRFASELSPWKGDAFFDRLVEYVADCLGFEVVVVGELPEDGQGPLRPIATYPQEAEAGATTRAVIGTHCDRVVANQFATLNDMVADTSLDVPLIGSDGRPIGLICGFGHEAIVDQATTRLLCRIVAHRAAAELERQRAQRALTRRDSLFVGLIAEAHDVVGVLDGDGAFTAVSPAIERVLGHRVQECIGLAVLELVHPLDRPAVEALLGICGGQGYSTESRIQKKDGGWLTMEVTVAEHGVSEGRRFKVLSARDLTEQRRLEDRLRQAQKTEIIGRLATGIAHDFSNILMVVSSHTDTMRLRTTADDPRHGYVDAIQAAVTRGADLARQLLAFSRPRESEFKLVDLNASVEQSAALLRRLVGSSFRLNTQLSPEARYVAADATQIEQVVLNLTLNARDAMPGGGAITFVTAPAGGEYLPAAVAAAPDHYVCFSVIDTGCGMSEEVQARIFEPLFTTKAEGAGTGIGLATVHDIVTRHGGCIDVASVEGQGTTFRVFLPRRVTPAPRAAARASCR